jgi:Protein of unknown function (DUF3592)
MCSGLWRAACSSWQLAWRSWGFSDPEFAPSLLPHETYYCPARGFEVARSPGALGAAFVTIAVLAVSVSTIAWHMRVMRTPARWPSVTGVIAARWVHEYVQHDSVLFEPTVEYTYSVDGAQFRSTRFWYMVSRYEDDRAAAEEDLTRFPVGSQVTVRYDPRHPDESVVKFGSPSAPVLVVGVLTMMLVIDSADAAAHGAKDWVTAFVVLATLECASLIWLIGRTYEKVDTFGDD